MVLWDENLSVGNDMIDNQHKNIFSLIEQFEKIKDQNIDSHDLKEHINTLLDRLLDYVYVHFRDEEILMERHGYRLLSQHKLQHYKLMSMVLMLRRKFIVDGVNVVSVLVDFINNWLVTHIKGTDMTYKPFISQREKV